MTSSATPTPTRRAGRRHASARLAVGLSRRGAAGLRLPSPAASAAQAGAQAARSICAHAPAPLPAASISPAMPKGSDGRPARHISASCRGRSAVQPAGCDSEDPRERCRAHRAPAAPAASRRASSTRTGSASCTSCSARPGHAPSTPPSSPSGAPPKRRWRRTACASVARTTATTMTQTPVSRGRCGAWCTTSTPSTWSRPAWRTVSAAGSCSRLWPAATPTSPAAGLWSIDLPAMTIHERRAEIGVGRSRASARRLGIPRGLQPPAPAAAAAPDRPDRPVRPRQPALDAQRALGAGARVAGDCAPEESRSSTTSTSTGDFEQFLDAGTDRSSLVCMSDDGARTFALARKAGGSSTPAL